MQQTLALTALYLASQAPHAAGDDHTSNPNIVYIFCDDLSYVGVHCLNPQRGKIATPQLDKLASQGMTFTEARSSSAVCTPTPAAGVRQRVQQPRKDCRPCSSIK